MTVAKTYYSKTSMGRFPFSFGGEAEFRFGRYITSDPREQKELDAIIPPLGNNPNIYTQEQLAIEANPPVAQNARSEMEVARGDAIVANLGNTRIQQETGSANFTPPNANDVNNSTLDPTLSSAMTGNGEITGLGIPPRVTGPGSVNFNPTVPNPSAAPLNPATSEMSSLEKIRAEAAARLEQSPISTGQG